MAIKILKSLCFVVASCLLSLAVSAQSALDLNPPSITHSSSEQFSPGKPLMIEAEITDDSGIEEASVFYRAGQVGNFQSIPLAQSAGDKYTAEIPTQKKQKTLQYYIEALDTGGNRVLEGNPSQPLTVSAKSRSNLLYLALGALAIGALAAAGGGDDGGESAPTSRTVTINATVPQ